MLICPKCRSFYSDETLKFCPADGVPLIEVDPASKLWPEGTEAVRQTTSRIQRQLRRQKLKKILSTTVTTVLVIMVVSVVTLNSYIYLNPEEKEIAQAIPTPTPVGETVSETPTPTPVSWMDTIFGTPTPTPTPTPGGDGEVPPPTPTPTVSDSPSPTPTIYVPPTPDEGTPTPPPPTPDWSTPPPTPDWSTPPPPSGCSPAERGLAIVTIGRHFNAWKNAIRESEENQALQRYAKEVGPGIPAKAALSFSPLSSNITLSEDCQNARVEIEYTWRVDAISVNGVVPREPKKYRGGRSYRCVNNGGSWACR